MSEHVLVPFDGSPLSERALERVCTRHPDDDVTVLCVIDPIDAVYEAEAKGLGAAESWVERATAEAEARLERAEALAADHGVAVTTAVEHGKPASEILDYVGAHAVDHVVMGSHGRKGASRLLLGSVAERVMRGSPVPVTVVR
ncbi:universal stress protein [Haloglomus litoreum]|uniref:universal stress protein n=1 Tax=Haloglomus litoreum TaxID=3034026 RepID=UPI0023E76EB4|nr:universal stress protein [Haloglomus sp. DT116]